MNQEKIGEFIAECRKEKNLTQVQLAEKLNMSYKSISKWETDETVPDIYQSKKLAKLYNLSLDELIEFDVDVKEIEEVIKNTNEEKEAKINWTNAWSKKYLVLAKYQDKVDVSKYALEIRNLLNSLSKDYGFNELDSMLVLKDILYHEWKDKK